MGRVVRVAVGTRAIRALFAGERPPVLDADWDEAAYIAQRLHAYAEALGDLALVQPMPDGGEDAAGAPAGGASFSCPRTGDRVRVEPDDHDDRIRNDSHGGIERALRRVFSDAHAWRRHLQPAYFERHRAWRAVVGAPIQH